MEGKHAANIVRKERHFLQNILEAFTAEHQDFRPTEEMMTVAQQVNHIARTVEWFRQGGFGSGFDTDMEKFQASNQTPIALGEAVGNLNRTYDDFISYLENRSPGELAAPVPPNHIVGEVPRFTVLYAVAEHTAHHRGVLSVYLRLLGIKPKMVYS